MKTARVLVIIPTVNRSRMCGKAVQSLLQQTYDDWNLVIAKNGTGPLWRYHKMLGDLLEDSRVHLLVLPGTGLAYALNKTLARCGAGHEFFANLEDDDEWHPEFLETMVGALEKGGDVAHCLQLQKPRRRQHPGGPMDTRAIKAENWINFPMCLFRTSLWGDIQFDPAAGPATDWDWHLRCLQAGARYKFVPKTLVTHWWHGANWCLRANRTDFIKERIAKGVYN